ncbi:MAG: hypothetical protein QXK17_04810 [Metallosphaera sp.]
MGSLEKETWIDDDYNLYFLLPKHTITPPQPHRSFSFASSR